MIFYSKFSTKLPSGVHLSTILRDIFAPLYMLAQRLQGVYPLEMPRHVISSHECVLTDATFVDVLLSFVPREVDTH